MREKGRVEVGRKALFCLFLLAVSIPLPAQRRVQRPLRSIAQNALPPALRRALAVAATLRFTGRRTVTVRQDGEPDRHEEFVTRDGPRVRIEFPSQGAYAGQVIVENATERRHFLPATNEVRILPPRRQEGLQRLRALAKTGKIGVEPGERIAGYPTVEIVVRDADGNALQRLSIEPDSGLVLRRRVYDATGAVVGGFAYTKVDLSPAPFDPSLFRIERKGVQQVTPRDMLRRLAKRSGYVPAGLPESTGFRLDTVRLAKQPGGDVLLQNYLGPGGRLSLYQLRTSVSPENLRRLGRGRRLNSVSWTGGGITYVLLGPQDQATLNRLKTSVEKD